MFASKPENAPDEVSRYSTSPSSVSFPMEMDVTDSGQRAEIRKAKRWLRSNGWQFEIYSCTWWHPRAVPVLQRISIKTRFRTRKEA